MRSLTIHAQVNGNPVTAEVPVRMTLADWLRGSLRLTGTHLGCEQGVCGACTVEIDGLPVRSCLTLACQVDGHEVWTVEGLAAGERLDPLQEAFWDHHAMQCGYCTPGMLMTARALLRENPAPREEEVREALSGNLCRCTGYQQIVDAILDAAGRKGGTA